MLTLRPAAPADLDGCARVYVAAAAIAFPWVEPEERGERQFQESVRGEAVWLAEGPKGIVGIVSIYLPNRFLHSLYVQPACQRRGIGRGLVDLALHHCGGHAHLKCHEANREACRFYLATGWQPAGWGWSPEGPWIRFSR